tara:strand:+ start:28686 stop:29000 length:315 start_codon:yes stop_codon:yes gene_type:complete
MNDPLDIPMTADDIQDMDPVMVASLWAKVRQSRADIASQREGLLEERDRMIVERDFMTTSRNELLDELDAERKLTGEIADQLDRCIRALAKVALRSIETEEEYQ